MRTIGSASGLLLLLALGAAWSASAETLAPDFTLPDLEGQKITLSEVSTDHAVLVSFWATWCVPCPQEMQHLQRFYETYQQQGLEILAISIDGNKTVAKVKPFVQGRRFNFPVLLDTNSDIMRLYQVKAVPAVFLLAPGRQLTYHHTGYKAGDEVALEAGIREVLALPAVKVPGDQSERSEGAEGETVDGEAGSENAKPADPDATDGESTGETPETGAEASVTGEKR